MRSTAAVACIVSLLVFVSAGCAGSGTNADDEIPPGGAPVVTVEAGDHGAPPVDGLGPQRQQTFQQSDHGLKSL
jgi:hypothetical protein